MESIHLDNLDHRTPGFARNTQLELLLKELSILLEPVDERVTRQFKQPQWPPLLLVGSPRSGTTFVMQLLNATGQFAIPTNLLSRFYYAPYMGAKIQQLLTDKKYDYNNEMGDFGKIEDFNSNLGKTSGALAISEFTYFWRRFIPNYDPQYLSPAEEARIDNQGLASGLAAIEAVIGKPLALKAFILQYNLPKLHEIFRNGVFVQVRRDVLYIMQSLYQARKAFYNTLDLWWSVKPKEFEELQHLDPYQQIAGQVFFTERALAAGLTQIPGTNQLVVEYEDVCQSPSGFYSKLAEKYKENGYDLPQKPNLPAAFTPSNEIRIPNAEIQKLVDAYDAYTRTTAGDKKD